MIVLTACFLSATAALGEEPSNDGVPLFTAADSSDLGGWGWFDELEFQTIAVPDRTSPWKVWPEGALFDECREGQATSDLLEEWWPTLKACWDHDGEGCEVPVRQLVDRYWRCVPESPQSIRARVALWRCYEEIHSADDSSDDVQQIRYCHLARRLDQNAFDTDEAACGRDLTFSDETRVGIRKACEDARLGKRNVEVGTVTHHPTLGDGTRVEAVEDGLYPWKPAGSDQRTDKWIDVPPGSNVDLVDESSYTPEHLQAWVKRRPNEEERELQEDMLALLSVLDLPKEAPHLVRLDNKVWLGDGPLDEGRFKRVPRSNVGFRVALMGAGAAVLGGGLVAERVGRANYDKATSPLEPGVPLSKEATQQLQEDQRAAVGLIVAGQVSMGAGGALLAPGIVWTARIGAAKKRTKALLDL